MPIFCPITPRPIAQEEFARTDYQVMREAFESQNSLGRLCDEVIYKNDFAARIEAAGLGPVRKEVPLTLTHRDYTKAYSMDLIVADTAVYELKTANQLALDHETQTLNYLLLWGAQHGKLVNFRSPKVESRFINTTLTPKSRRQIEVDSSRWEQDNETASRLQSTVLGLLEDWGLFLELPLYLEALIHFLGGEEQVVSMVPLARNGLPLGNQRLHLLTPDTEFRLSAITGNTEDYERQLRSLLRHTTLRACQWINMAHHQVQFVTLQRQ